MNDINVYLMDMSFEGNASGVSRYLSVLTAHLKGYTYLHVYHIKFLGGRSVLFYQENKTDHYTEIIVPLPQQTNKMIGERYWYQKYTEYSFTLIRHLFENKTNRIIHIHTLNLIGMASYIKNLYSCKIITHLHCIPWKTFYTKNSRKFNQLYAGIYQKETPMPQKELFFSNNCEWESYTAADKIICVTECASIFLEKAMEIQRDRIEVIPNGINDVYPFSSHKKRNNQPEVYTCLFVGVLSESKGIYFILKALRQVQALGYSVCLNMAGIYAPSFKKEIEKEYGDLQINILGRISFETLQEYYQESNIGVIASLHEQCSYAAIEMAMFGLPIITTAVDGLDEMFTDEVNALKVNIIFSKVFGLRVDTNELAKKIVILLENANLRMQLGRNARKLYEERFHVEQMMKKTIRIYNKMRYE